MPAGDIARAILVAFIYGVSFVAIKIAVTDLPPLLVTGYRFFFAAFPLILLVARPAAPWVVLAGYGFVQGTVMFGLAFNAIAMGMPAGLTSLIVQLQVFFTILLAAMLFAERPTGRQITGTSLGLAGIALLGTGTTAVQFLPFLMVVGAALAWAVANIIVKLAPPKPGEAIAYVVWSSPFAAIPLFALSSLVEGTVFASPPHMPSLSTVISIAFLAVVTQIGAFALWVGLLGRRSAASVMPFALLIPVFGIGSTAAVFGEPLSALTIAASGVVLAGLALAVFPPLRKAGNAIPSGKG